MKVFSLTLRTNNVADAKSCENKGWTSEMFGVFA